jgi:hypothetical protein
MNLMHCGKTVVLSYDKIEKNQQLMSFVRQLGYEIIYIKPKNLFLAKYFSKIKENNDVKYIVIDKHNYGKYAKYLQQNIYKNAKLIYLSLDGSGCAFSDLILTSNMNSILQKYISKTLFYSGALCLPKFEGINYDFSINDNIVDSIKQSIIFTMIGGIDNKIVVNEKNAQIFCNSVIEFAKKNDSFVFVAINIKNNNIFEYIKKEFYTVNCYIFDISKAKSFSKYYSFLNVSKFIVHFGINVEQISWLSTFEKYLYIFAEPKNNIFYHNLISKNIVLYSSGIIDNNIKSKPINPARFINF